MHAIKSAARKQAWYHNNDPDSRTYNIFGRGSRNPRRLPDEERDSAGTVRLNHVQSESDATTPVESKRRDGWNSQPVRKSGTFPTRADSDRGHVPNHDVIHEDPEKSPISEDAEKSSREEHESSDTTHHAFARGKVEDSSTGPMTTSTEQSVGTHKTSRRRKFLGMKFGGKKDEDDSELSHTETNQSSKSSKSKKYANLKFTPMGQIKAIFGSWINLLLVFVPVGLAAEYAHLSPGVVFVMNFIAIIPLASMLSYATEELAYYVGDTFGGLLNASFGNATELIVSIIALVKGEVLIVQTSLIGSMLSNLLLVMGMCFFFGGINRLEQHFNITVAQTAASLLALAIGALVTPTAFRIFSENDAGVVPTSRAASILILLTYICYLFFQLRTHIDMYNKPSPKAEKQNLVRKDKKPQQEVNMSKGLSTIGARASATAGGSVNRENLVVDNEEEEEDQPQLSKWWALGTLAASTALIAVTSDGLVSAIDPITADPDTGKGGPLSKEFVGLILLPIVGNAAEHATAVTVAIKDKMDLAIGVAVGSSLQIVLLVLPVMVILGWIGVGAGVSVNGAAPVTMDLNFDGFQVVVLFIAIILVNYVIQDGSSHWLEGVMLMITYIIFAVAAWYYPGSAVPL